jgi:hypothetical protein
MYGVGRTLLPSSNNRLTPAGPPVEIVGTESIDRLGSLARDFNLKLLFAMTSGVYVSGVRVAAKLMTVELRWASE